MLIIDEFATEFEIELVEHFDAFFDFFLLNFEILCCIKTFFHETSLIILLLYHFVVISR